MKKIFKIFGITLLIIIALLVAIPFAFQGHIKDMVKQFINENLNAQVEFSDVNLSFIRSFPEAQVNVTDLKITIKNSALTYIDATSKMIMHLTELNHEGHGTFSGNASELNTKSNANVSFDLDNTSYLSSNPVKLEALIGLDLKNNIYTFKENKGYINQLPIAFQGHVQLLEGGQDIDIANYPEFRY